MSFNGATPPLFGSISGVTATRGGRDPELGTRIVYEGNEYVYAYNAGNSEIPVGYCAVPVTGGSAYSCTVSSTASNDLPMGVVKHATLTTGTYGWLLTKGYGTAHVAAAAAAGTAMEIGANGILQTHLTGVCVCRTLAVVSAATNISCSAYFRI